MVAANRLFLQQIERHITAGRDFAFETTLSGRGYLRLVRRLRSAGWRVELLYLALPSAELSRLRVAERVAHGGIRSWQPTLPGASHAACLTCWSCMPARWTMPVASSTAVPRQTSCSPNKATNALFLTQQFLTNS